MSKRGSIGIVREAYSLWERRAPFTPSHVDKLVNKMGIEVVVQPSLKRVFKDAEYARAGAIISDDLSKCNALFGVKKVPIESLLPDKTYLFFSHVIKGQLENMELLDKILEKNIRLIDYECITKDGIPGKPRLVAFGDYAGKSGMIDTLRGLGQQLLHQGISTPFLNVGSAYMYPSYVKACEAIKEAGASFCSMKNDDLFQPSRFDPLVFLFTGSGNVNRGARQVFQNLPHTMISPSELTKAIENPPSPIIGCQVSVEDMVQHVGGGKFDKEEYYAQPNLYTSVFFEKYARHSNVLVNGAYWDARYPRLVSRDDLKKFPERRLHLISDISCDINGGVEILSKPASIEEPFYYPDEDYAKDIMMMGVDILPSELPREASQHFGDYLLPFVDGLAQNLGTTDLQPEVENACIADKGALYKRFKYIQKMRFERERSLNVGDFCPATEEARAIQLKGSSVLRIEGHLFDTGLINKMLDVVEAKAPSGRFHIVECLVGPKQRSMVLLQVTMDEGRKALDDVIKQMKDLIQSSKYKSAQASFQEMPEQFCNGNYEATLKDALKVADEKDAASHVDHSTKNLDFSSAPSLQRVLVLGAGMVAKPCVEYLSRDSSRLVVVASAVPHELKSLTQSLSRSNIEPYRIDAGKDKEELEHLIGTCDVVISLLPWQMHTEIAKSCIKKKVKMVTASYISPAMQALDQEAKDAGISILCEMGLDPGMDHLSAKMIIDDMHDAGEKVVSFTSVCGGLTAPEAADNPFGYKFSWSPRGVLSAMQNSAIYFKDGKTIKVDGKDLLAAAEPFNMHMMPSLALEQLPNRDSTVYAEKYNIPEAKTCFRGTLRYAGFSEIMLEFVKAGFLKENITFDECVKNLRSLSQTKSANNALDWLLQDYHTDKFGQGVAIDMLCQVLQDKLALQPHERDMCAMQHTFNGEHHISTLIAMGDSSSTAMAKTVGVTVAIAADLVLDKSQKVSSSTGVLMPTERHIYKPALDLLEKEGLTFKIF